MESNGGLSQLAEQSLRVTGTSLAVRNELRLAVDDDLGLPVVSRKRGRSKSTLQSLPLAVSVCIVSLTFCSHKICNILFIIIIRLSYVFRIHSNLKSSSSRETFTVPHSGERRNKTTFPKVNTSK
jgi:hypothetical protein